MAEVLPSNAHSASAPPPVPNPERTKPDLPAVTIPSAPAAGQLRSGHLNLDVFSPVNQNGSFEFDRVLKHGDVQIRSRKTKQWKRYFLVLRPNLLSMYKTKSEEKLLKQITLSDMTAVATPRDAKRPNVFALYSPAKNYHVQATSEHELHEWVALIRAEARVEERADDDSRLSTGAAPDAAPGATEPPAGPPSQHQRFDSDRLWSSSPEPVDVAASTTTTRDGVRIPKLRQGSVPELDYSGNEGASYSDLSDAGGLSRSYVAASSPPGPSLPVRTATRDKDAAAGANAGASTAQGVSADAGIAAHTGHQLDGAAADIDGERVVWHGYLLSLRTKGGVRQWKRLWAVLRPKSLTFYKNEEEYAAQHLIAVSSILSADEIDPVSRGKVHCLQIIVEDKSHKFCAADEEALTRFLGALKSLLAKRREKEAASARRQ